MQKIKWKEGKNSLYLHVPKKSILKVIKHLLNDGEYVLVEDDQDETRNEEIEETVQNIKDKYKL